MPLDALKHRCLDYIKSERVYIECFEQASFSYALGGEHLASAQGLELGIERSLRELGDADLSAQIEAIRRAHFPIDIKAHIFKIIITQRLKTLGAMIVQTPAGSMEERYAASMFEATHELYDFVFSSSEYAKIAAFFDDIRLLAAFYEHDKSMNLPSFAELFDWPQETRAAQKAAARAFSHLFRSQNRRAKFLRFDARGPQQFNQLREFFSRQEGVFKQIISDGAGSDAASSGCGGAGCAKGASGAKKTGAAKGTAGARSRQGASGAKKTGEAKGACSRQNLLFAGKIAGGGGHCEP